MTKRTSPDADIEIARWGDPAQWRDFFKERQLRRDFAASLVLRDPCVYVSHGDFECQMASPRMDGRTVSFLDYPWSHPVAGVPHGRLRVKAALTTDLRERDVVLGGAGKLDSLLSSLSRHGPRKSLVVLSPDCVPLLTGEDVEGVVARHARGMGPRLTYLNLAADPRTTLFEKLFRKVRGKRARRASRTVNLAGFPDVPGTRELCGLLAELGVRVNARLLPDFSVDEMRRWGKAGLQVLLPHGMLEPVYRRALADTGLRTIAPPAPYGIGGTRRWLEAVLTAVGRGHVLRRAWPRLSASASARFRKVSGELRGRGVALVEDLAAVSRYADPRRTCGVPVLALLAEMGLRVSLLLYHERRTRPLRKRMSSARVRVRRFSKPEELARLLAADDFQAVFSNVFFDTRITRAGKVPVSLRVFETGLEGAVRSARRLAGACRLRFYEKNIRV